MLQQAAAAVRAERDAALKALQAERDLRQAPNDPSLKTKARDAANAQRDARAIVDACAQDCRDAAARASMSQSAKSALDAEAGRAAVAATDLLVPVVDVLACKPSELAFYPVPKLMIRRVGDHEAFSASRANELGDGTEEARTVADAVDRERLSMNLGISIDLDRSDFR